MSRGGTPLSLWDVAVRCVAAKKDAKERLALASRFERHLGVPRAVVLAAADEFDLTKKKGAP